MDYHLKPIEQFVSNYVKPDNSFIDRLPKTFLEEVISQLMQEIEKIKIGISSSYYSFDNANSCDHFIKNHQRRIINLINDINKNCIKKKALTDAKSSILHLLVNLLTELLRYLEQEYAHALDEESFITDELGSEKAREFSKIISDFNIQFCYSDSLFSIAIEPIQTFFGRDKTTYTYRQLKYFNRLIKEIDQLQRTVVHGYKTELTNMLIYINFNNNAFLNYLIDQILSDVYKEETLKAQILKLRFHQKLFRQRQTKCDIAFLPYRRNIREQIVDWISEEIIYLDSSKKLLKKEDHRIKPNMAPKKFRLDLSVEQIGVLIKIAVDAKIIQTEELRPFVRFVAEHFSSKKSENISESNLYNKTYLYDIDETESIRQYFEVWIDKMTS